jgi:uncharacterized protein
MFLDLTRIHGPREHVERDYPASALDTSQDEFQVRSGIQLGFDVEKKDQRYRLAGVAEATLELRCSRCDEAFTLPVRAPFDVTYLPQSANAGEGEHEVAEEDLDSAFYEHERIDLGQLVREQFYLAMPMKPLCADACRGLCPACGINRNTGTCACEAAWEDPRLAPLKDLLGRDDRQA